MMLIYAQNVFSTFAWRANQMTKYTYKKKKKKKKNLLVNLQMPQLKIAENRGKVLETPFQNTVKVIPRRKLLNSKTLF
jgi:hypothetical protein